MSFALYREVSPSTTVELCATANFTTTTRREVVVSRKNVLEVYWIVDGQIPTGNSFFEEDLIDNEAALELKCSYQLSGTIESLSVVRGLSHNTPPPRQSLDGDDVEPVPLPNPGLDCLLLTFDAGKVSLVAHDFDRPRALRTVALFNFEEEALASGLQASKGGIASHHAYGSRATAIVDPNNRCAVMLLYESQLAVVPFISSRDMDMYGVTVAKSQLPNGTQRDRAPPGTVVAPFHADSDIDHHHRPADEFNEDNLDLITSVLKGGDGGNKDGNPGTVHRHPVVVAQEGAASLWESGTDCPHIGRSFLVRLSMCGIPAGSIRDIVFLQGYHATTSVVAILHTTAAKTWTGRIAARRHNCIISVFSLLPHDPANPANVTLIWRVRRLPHDAFKLIPVPSEHSITRQSSSVLVLSANAIQLIGPSKKDQYSLALNGDASITVDTHAFPLRDINGSPHGGALKQGVDPPARVSRKLAGANCVWLDHVSLLLSDPESGNLGVLSLLHNDTYTLNNMYSTTSLRFDVQGTSNPSSCMCLVKQQNTLVAPASAPTDNDDAGETEDQMTQHRLYVFLGSRHTDSLLIETTSQNEGVQQLAAKRWQRQFGVKRLRIEDPSKDRMDQDRPIAGAEQDEAENDLALYGTTATAGVSPDGPQVSTFSFQVRDRILVNGPVTSITRAVATTPAAEFNQQEVDVEGESRMRQFEEQAKALAAKGSHSAAANVRVQAKRYAQERQRQRALKVEPVDYEVITTAGRGKNGSLRMHHWGIKNTVLSETVLKDCVSMWTIPTRNQDVRVFVTTRTHTRVLSYASQSSDIAELSASDVPFRLNVPTLHVASGDTGDWLLQVCPSEILLFDTRSAAGKLAHKMSLEEVCATQEPTNRGASPSTAAFCTVSVCDPFVLVQLSDGNLRLLEVSEGKLGAASCATQFTALLQSFATEKLAPIALAQLHGGATSAAFSYTGLSDGMMVQNDSIVVTFMRGGLTEARAGCLEAYSLPKFEHLFVSDTPMASGCGIIHNAMAVDRQNKDASFYTGVMANTMVVDMSLALVGETTTSLEQANSASKFVQTAGTAKNLVPSRVCLLLAMSNGDVIVYHARPTSTSLLSTQQQHSSELQGDGDGDVEVVDDDVEIVDGPFSAKKVPCQVTLERVESDIVTRGLREKVGTRTQMKLPDPLGGDLAQQFRFPLFFPFKDLCDMNGVFVASITPVWVVGGRGVVKLVPVNAGEKRKLPLPVQRSSQVSASAAFSGNPEESTSPRTLVSRIHVDLIRGPIPAFCTLPANGTFMYYYSAPMLASASEDGKNPLNNAPGKRPSADERLATPCLRFCSFLPRETPRTAHVDQGGATVVESVNLGRGTIQQFHYVDFASHGAPFEKDYKVHSPVYCAIVTKSYTSKNLPDVSGPEENLQVNLLPEGEKEIEGVEENFALRPDIAKPDRRFGGAPYRSDANSVLTLYQGDQWGKPCDEYELLPFERGICLELVKLKSDKHGGALRDYIAIGTGQIIPEGEDRSCKGRALLFEIAHISSNDERPNPQTYAKNGGRPGTVPKFRVVCDRVTQINNKEPRGPVTAISSLNNMILLAIGNMPSSIKLCHMNENTRSMVPVKFFDASMCVVNLKVLNQYILAADMYRSVHFIKWTKKQNDFSLIAKMSDPMRVYCAEFLVNEPKLGLVINDEMGNIRVMGPTRPMQCIADFHLGSNCMSFLPITLQNTANAMGHQKAGRRDGLFFGTLDGALGSLIPIDETVFRRLFAIQAAMVKSELVRHNAGLNPRGYRLLKSDCPLNQPRKGNIADGRLLKQFLSFDYMTQRALARMVGTTADAVIDNFLEIELMSRW